MDVDKIQVTDISVEFIGAQEAFMLTQCYRARIAYEYEGAAEELKLFVKKTPPMPQEIFDAVSFKALFSNEILAYEKIIPNLEAFAGINFNTARFYFGHLQGNAAIVITEDFGSKGWQIAKARYNLSLDHTLLAMKYLARLHAAGFALLHKDKQAFQALTKDLQESRYGSDDIHYRWALTLRYGLERAVKSAKDFQRNVPQEFLEKLQHLLMKPMPYGRKLVRPKDPFVTLCHGDYLRNNVAYKYDAGKPIDIMMFDLQTLRVSSPMLDLTIFLALSTLAEVRQKHFKDIFGTYCQQLKEGYEKFAQRPLPGFLSYESLIKEYIAFLPHSILTTSTFLLDLVAPRGLSSEEMLNAEATDEEIFEEIMFKGGELVDRELAHQVSELYDLSMEHNVDVFSV
uniref:Ecdysteroid kinase n=1 Tax=Musca domestica TaxID=7370 RepID=T1PH75_MUSDO